MAIGPTGTADIYPVLSSLKRTVDRYLPGCSNKVFALLDCAALRETTFTTLRHLPYILGGGKLGLNTPSHFINVRIAYLGAMFQSLASLVYSVAMAVFYTILCFTPFVFFTDVFSEAKKYWVYIPLSLTCMGINFVGFFIPTFAAYLNMGIIYLAFKSIAASYNSDLKYFEKPLVAEVKRIYSKNEDVIHLFFIAHVGGTAYYRAEIDMALKDFKSRIKLSKTVDELIGAVGHVLQNFPRIQSKQHGTPSKHIHV